MQTSKQTMLLATSISGVVLGTGIFVEQFFPDLTFVSGSLVIANRILGYLAFIVFVLSIMLLLRLNKTIRFCSALILSCFFFINSCGEIYPIDTIEKPFDASILQTYGNGNKLIVREFENAKTTNVLRDTILVNDVFIFRRILEHKTTTR
ncbi:hypothetical protein [Pedobacter sp. SYSU D00535]|uniref:hypothetical protein n=1 Tax=Pedobacter sp. SYSU D00535 TaxID=2810308 RepID=UPI001A95F554|nr:hypothetical protein [Pedobacter sp. SYSU D00535]